MPPAVSSALAVLLALPFYAQPADAPAPLRMERSGDAMGTTFTVVAYADDEPRMIAAVENAFDEVHRVDRLLSNYRPSSEWSVVNRKAAEGPVKVSSELFELLARCQEYSRASGGAFDVTVGPLMKLWGFYRGSGRVPHRAEIRAVLGRIGYRHIELDPEAQTVRFIRSGIEMDPGGIGKGYAVDRMAAVLRESGIRTAFISGSASSLYAMGAPPGQEGWTVKIRDPRDRRKTVEEVSLRDESMSTSGTFEKFFRARGRLYSHIMDPRTGYPATGMLMVSVIAPLTLDSEAWTKPIFVNGRQWAAAHKPKGLRAFVCEDKMDQPCAWLR